ncbi:hypothetical protein JHK82_031476 [Glycine max]|nr:hypothetical protein JHK82_031476 [Glycine max]
MQIDIFFVVAPNLQVVVIIKKGENVNHEDFDDIKKNLLEKGGDVNHASFDGVEKKLHVCHHQKGGECECMYT